MTDFLFETTMWLSALSMCLVGVVANYRIKQLEDERDNHAAKMIDLGKVAKQTGWTDDQKREFEANRFSIERIDADLKRAREDQDRDAYLTRLNSGHSGSSQRQERHDALRAWVLEGTGDQTDKMRTAAKRQGLNLVTPRLNINFATVAPRKRSDVRTVYAQNRAQGVSTPAAGGNLQADEMMQEIEIALLKYAKLRQVATVYRTETGGDFPIPRTNDTANKGEIITENTTHNEGDVVFSNLVLGAHKYSSKIVRVSIELFQDSGINVEVLLGQLLGERIGRIQGEHHTTGDGSNKPNGIVPNAVDSGITLASNTAVTYPELINLVHSVDDAYRDEAMFMFHDDVLQQIRKITDSNGNPLWMPGLADGMPPTILGYPYLVNNEMPTGASAKSIIFGDLRKFVIRDVTNTNLVRLNERYAEYGQVAFLQYQRSDAALNDAGTNPVKFATAAA